MINVDLLLPEDSFDQSKELDSWNNPREHLTGRSKNGVAHFPLVEFNQRIRVVATSSNGELRAELYGEGPVRNGGPAIFTLNPQADNPVLLGTILNTEGAVGPNLNLEYRFKTTSDFGNSSSNSGTLKTDENGRFRLLVEETLEEESTRTLTISLRATRKKPKRSVPIDLSYALMPGENELGDLVLVVPPLIASGMVVDIEGNALSNAQVRVEKKQFYGEEEDQFWWNDLWEHRGKTDRDGKFEVRAILEPDIYRLSASREKYIDSSYVITPGEENVRLILGKSITLKGRVLLEDGIDPALLDIVMDTPDPNREGHQLSFHTVLKKNGSFLMEDLPPGPASLIVRAKKFQEVFYTQERLILESSSGTQVFEDINLRGMLRSIRIWVRDVRGELVPHVKIWPQWEGHQDFSNKNPFDTVTLEADLGFQISAQGYQILNLPDAIGEQEVVLQEGFPIKVEIDNLHILPTGWELHLMLYPRGKGANPRLRMPIDEFGAHSSPTHIMMHGSYRVRYLMQESGKNARGKRHWLNMKELTMEVADLSLLQTFRYSLEEEAVLSATQD